ncbi:MAG: hypothetical protein JXA92_12600 [candidate division Zixibacteria bacterium]|nr:hypothetical protein [candidate division Zixibacteria bacterium]
MNIRQHNWIYGLVFFVAAELALFYLLYTAENYEYRYLVLSGMMIVFLVICIYGVLFFINSSSKNSVRDYETDGLRLTEKIKRIQNSFALFLMQRNELYGKIIHSDSVDSEGKQRALGLLMDLTTLNQSSEAILALNRDWQVSPVNPEKLSDGHDPRVDRYWKLLNDARKTILEMETVLYKYLGNEMYREDISLPSDDPLVRMEERLNSLIRGLNVDADIVPGEDNADSSEEFKKTNEDYIDTDKIDISHV